MMRKRRIVHLIGSLTRGGAERFVIDLCNELVLDGQYEVYLISICANDPVNSLIGEIDKNVIYECFEKKAGFSLRTFLTLSRWLNNRKPDVVHSHLNSFEYLGWYLLRNNQTLFFHTIHNVAKEECPNFMIKSFRKLFFRRNRVIPVTISDDGSKTFRDYYHLDNDILIPNGRQDMVRSNAFQGLRKRYKSVSGSFLLVHVGRISAEKNQDLLIRAVQQFNVLEDRKCKLLILGEVKDESLYQRLLRVVDGDEHIEFIGGKHNVVDYLGIADVFCLSSFFEGMPIALIEALSVGCIPVCTPVGGIRQMIAHGKTGFLSKDVTVNSFYLAIKEALDYDHKEVIRMNSKLCFKLNYHIKNSARTHSETYFRRLAACS